MFEKIIDTNFDNAEQFDPNDRYLIFVLSNTNSLFNAIYYSMKLTEYKCILVWDKGHVVDFNYDFAKKYFYKYYIVNDIRKESFVIKVLLKLFTVGYFYKYSEWYKFLEKSKIDSIIIYNDLDCMSQRIIKCFGDTSCVILGDEGTGVYSIHCPLFSVFKQIVTLILFGIVYGTHSIGENKKIKYYFLKYPSLVDKRKRIKFENIVEANEPFADENFVTRMVNDINLDSMLLIDSNKMHYLYLGNKTNIFGIQDKDVMETIRLIANGLDSTENLLIKLHPGEANNKYDDLCGYDKIRVINLNGYNWIPVELIARYIMPECVLTILSAAAYNVLKIGASKKVCYLFKMFPQCKVDCSLILPRDNSAVRNIGSINDFLEFKSCVINDSYDQIVKCNKNYDIKFFKFRK